MPPKLYKNPLSSWIYFVKNKLRLLILVAIFALSLISILMPKTLFQSLEGDFNRYTNFFKRTSVINIQTGLQKDNSSVKNLEKSLQSNPDVDYFIKGDFSFITIKSIQGQFYQPVAFLSDNDYEKFLNSMSWELIQGKLPEKNTNEIALTENIAKNKNLKIGDLLGSDISNNNEYLTGKFRVSGIIKSVDSDGAIANLDYHTNLYGQQEPPYWSYYIFPKNNQIGAAKNTFNQLKQTDDDLKQLKIFDYETEISFLNEVSQIFSLANWILNLTITITICSVLILLNQINIFLRQSEIGILLAIGYTKIEILKRFITESLIQISISYTAGMLLIKGLSNYFNAIFFDKFAISPIDPWAPEILLFSIPLPIVAFVSVVILYLIKFYKIDPISLID